jgi:hypothetical protein
MSGWFRNEATAIAPPPTDGRRGRVGKALLRPVFALSALALLVFLNLDDDRGGDDGVVPFGRRAATATTTTGTTTTTTIRHPDGTVAVVEVDGHGERFAGVSYADDEGGGRPRRRDRDANEQRGLSYVEGHVIVELSPGKDPDVECPLLAEVVGGTVDQVLRGPLFNGCAILPSEFAMQAAGDGGSLPLEGEDGVEAVEEDGIVEAYQQNWAIWNLNRIDQCNLPLEEGPYTKEDASGVKLFVMDTGVFGGHDEFAAQGGIPSPIDPSDPCHYSVVDSPMMPLFDGNGHG